MLVASLALVSSVVLGVTSTFAHAGTAALIMGGSGLGDPTEINDAGLHIPMPNYIPNVENYYIAPNSTCQPATCRLVPVDTPEGLLPPIIGTTTFDPSVAAGVSDLATALGAELSTHPGEQVVIFGYSQSGDIITKTLRNYASDPATAPPKSQVSFVVIGDTNRPNGGILSRFPGLYIPFLNVTEDGAAPTNTGYHTTDIAFEYDPVADFPQYPIDLLSDLNAAVGFLDVHATYPNPYLPLPAGIPFLPTALPDGYTPGQLAQAMNDPANRQTFGDTTYITIPALNLPLLQPLLDIGKDTGTSFVIKPVVDLIQPALKVLVDLGYDRTVPFGQATPAGLIPKIDLSALAADLGAAVGQGVHDALADIGVSSLGSFSSSMVAPKGKTVLTVSAVAASTDSQSAKATGSPVTKSAKSKKDKGTAATHRASPAKGQAIDRASATTGSSAPSSAQGK